MSEVGEAIQIVALGGKGMYVGAKLTKSATLAILKLLNTLYLAKWKGKTSFLRFQRIKGSASMQFLNIYTEDKNKLNGILKEMKKFGILTAQVPDLKYGDGKTQMVFAEEDAQKLLAYLDKHREGKYRYIKLQSISSEDYELSGHEEDGELTQEYADLEQSAREAVSKKAVAPVGKKTPVTIHEKLFGDLDDPQLGQGKAGEILTRIPYRKPKEYVTLPVKKNAISFSKDGNKILSVDIQHDKMYPIYSESGDLLCERAGLELKGYYEDKTKHKQFYKKARTHISYEPPARKAPEVEVPKRYEVKPEEQIMKEKEPVLPNQSEGNVEIPRSELKKAQIPNEPDMQPSGALTRQSVTFNHKDMVFKEEENLILYDINQSEACVEIPRKELKGVAPSGIQTAYLDLNKEYTVIRKEDGRQEKITGKELAEKLREPALKRQYEKIAKQNFEKPVKKESRHLSKVTPFNDFDQRDYDYDALLAQLKQADPVIKK